MVRGQLPLAEPGGEVLGTTTRGKAGDKGWGGWRVGWVGACLDYM